MITHFLKGVNTMKILILALVVCLSACGMEKEKDCSNDNSKCEKIEPIVKEESLFFYLRGSVVGAFATEVAVSYAEVDTPVILTSYQTQLTDYACEDVAPNQTLNIPDAE